MTNPTRTRRSPVAAALAAAAALVAGACDDEPAAPPPREHRRRGPAAAGAGRKREQADVMLPGAIADYHNPTYRPWTGAAGLGEVPGAVAHAPRRPVSRRQRAQDVSRDGHASARGGRDAVAGPDAARAATRDRDLAYRVRRPDHAAHVAQPHQRHPRVGGPGSPCAGDRQPESCLDRGRGHRHRVGPASDLRAGNRRGATRTPTTRWSDWCSTVPAARAGAHRCASACCSGSRCPDTSLPEPGDTALAGSYAHGYQQIDGGGGRPLGHRLIDGRRRGRTRAVTTAQDLGRFIEALLSGKLFARPATLAAMTTMVDAPHESGLPHRYGFALEEFTLPDGTTARPTAVAPAATPS